MEGIISASCGGSCAIPETNLECVISMCEDYAATKCPHREMSKHEIAAVRMYTLEFKKIFGDMCKLSLYSILNEKLRNEDRHHLILYREYILLLLHAIRKCRPVEVKIVYRGIKFRASLEDFQIGKLIIWYQFSSCTIDIGIQQKFIGDEGERTLFHIEIVHGRARMINEFSAFPEEVEVVFPPYSHFEVVGNYNAGNGLLIIHLREVAPLEYIVDFSLKKVGYFYCFFI